MYLYLFLLTLILTNDFWDTLFIFTKQLQRIGYDEGKHVLLEIICTLQLNPDL